GRGAVPGQAAWTGHADRGNRGITEDPRWVGAPAAAVRPGPGGRVLARGVDRDRGARADPGLGSGRDRWHGGGPDADASGRVGGTAGGRPGRAVLRQPDRPAAGGHRGAGPGTARILGPGVPGRWAVPGRGAVHDRGPDRGGPAGGPRRGDQRRGAAGGGAGVGGAGAGDGGVRVAPLPRGHEGVGDICRYPMAERLLTLAVAEAAGVSQEKAQALVLSHSAGTGGWHEGEPMHPSAARQVRARGGDADGFAARQLRSEHLDGGDLVLTATSDQLRYVVSLRADAAGRTFVLGEFGRLLRRVDPEQLPRPGLSPEAVYERGAALVAAVDTARRGAAP